MADWRDIRIDKSRVAELEKKHEKLWTNDPDIERLVIVGRDEIVNVPYVERFENPAKMLEAELQGLANRMEVGDDSIPTVRVNFGTGLIATVFGVEMLLSDTGLPFASHESTIKRREDLRPVDEIDPLMDGELARLYSHIEYFKGHLPDGVHLTQADLQGPWNSAHLIMGDSIFTDTIDDPEFVTDILDHVTGAMLRIVKPMKEIIGEPEDVFYLYGAKVPGGGRVCNCSTDMISPRCYKELIIEHDQRFLDGVNGGFIHICGNRIQIVDVFNEIESLRGLEFNFNYIDLFEITERVRPDVLLMCTGPVDSPLLTPLGDKTVQRLFAGELPEKRNILFTFDDPHSFEYSRQLVDAVHRCN